MSIFLLPKSRLFLWIVWHKTEFSTFFTHISSQAKGWNLGKKCWKFIENVKTGRKNHDKYPPHKIAWIIFVDANQNSKQRSIGNFVYLWVTLNTFYLIQAFSLASITLVLLSVCIFLLKVDHLEKLAHTHTQMSEYEKYKSKHHAPIKHLKQYKNSWPTCRSRSSMFRILTGHRLGALEIKIMTSICFSPFRLLIGWLTNCYNLALNYYLESTM